MKNLLLIFSILILAHKSLSLQFYKQKGFGEPCTNRKAWDKVVLRTDKDHDHLNMAQNILKTSIPKWDETKYLEFFINGSRNNGEDMMRERQRLDRIVFAECKLNQGTYMPLIEKWLLELCNQTWSWPQQDSEFKDNKGRIIKNAKSYLNGEYYIDLNSGNFLFN